MAVPASTSTGADSNNNPCYDVFINHRGPDVKKTLASHLYRRLISYGLRVFLDYQELQEGEELTCQIQGAIKTASVHVAIFSPTYAESQWCLNELELMLESRAPIIPVFHHVKPAEVRRTQGGGVYALALHKLENKITPDFQPRYNSSTIETWRNALSRVADISGLDLEAFNGDEGELVDKIVEVVLRKGKKTELNVARYPAGLDEKVEDFETKILLQQHSGRVQVVGITGLGGVGKTTLAKELFNRKSSNYSEFCILFDVRENAKKSLPSLQKRLLEGLTHSDQQIDSIDVGIGILKKNLSALSSPVLLVLDDVDHADQVYALLPFTDNGMLPLPLDSLILMTSRDKNVLVRSGVQESSIYKLTGLNRERSRELFCSHAFCQPHPRPGFEYLVDQFLTACSGLPLSLKVFGGLLYGNTDKSSWKDELERLEHILPDEIQKRLQISYDALQRDEQQIFLDIACFFIGENRDTAIRVWDGSGWKGSRGFQSLLDKCLVEVDYVEVNNGTTRTPMARSPMATSVDDVGVINEENVGVTNVDKEIEHFIRMHDHLRDLGRDLAKDSGLPCRLWCGTKNIDDLLQGSSEAIEVRGIRMLPREFVDDWTKNSDDLLQQSYVTQAGMEFDGGICQEATKVPGIRMLPWESHDDEEQPVDDDDEPDDYASFSRYKMKRLQLLYASFSRSKMKKLQLLYLDGIEEDFFKCILKRVDSPKLIWLRWHNYPCSSLPPCIPMDKLRVLQLQGTQLETLWQDELQAPLQLRELHIDAPLSKIPKSLGHMKHLERMVVISHSEIIVKIPLEFYNLRSLKQLKLEISKMTSLPDSPRSFGNLASLKHIDMSRCSALERLPDSFGHLASLEHINLSECSALERLPDSFGHLASLERINLSWCRALERLPDSFGHLASLERINLSRCSALERLPDSFGNLIKLKYLDLSCCSKLTLSSGSFGNIRTLESINLSLCNNIEILPSQIAHQRSLEKLFLRLPSLKEWPSAIGEPSSLKKLVLDTPLLETLPSSLGHNLRNLQCLELRNCRILKCLPDSVLLLNQLIEWTVDHCSLRELHFKAVEGEIETLTDSGGQRTLSNLNRCLLRLQHLQLHRTQISEVSFPTGVCPNLQHLDIRDCEDLVEVGTLPNSLTKLQLICCPKLKNIERLCGFAKLQTLDVSRCKEVEELPITEGKSETESRGHITLSNLDSSLGKYLFHLQHLELHSIQISEVSFPTGVCPNLKHLYISDCEDLAVVGTLPNALVKLELTGCSRLSKIEEFCGLARLPILKIKLCGEVPELPSVETLVSSEELQVHKCVKLKQKRIRGLAQLTQLRELDISGCPELEELPGLEHLKWLEKLWAAGCVKLTSIRGLAQLTQLGELDVSHCYELEEMSGVENLKLLKKLQASHCVKLKSIRGLALLTKLRELDVSGCFELEELPGIGHLRSLEKFRAYSCTMLKSIRGSAQLTQLLELDVSHCYELEELGVENLKLLVKLQAYMCVKLKSIKGLAQLIKLREIDVSHCYELEEMPGVENLKSLVKLQPYLCVKLKSIRCSAKLTGLRELDVSGCSELEELPGVEHLKCLEKLHAFGCMKLNSIKGLEQLTRLRELDISGCAELEELPSVEHLRSLEKLWAYECVKLKSIQGLAQLTQLQELDVSGCSELEELLGLEHLISLDKLHACNCVKLRSIQGLAQLTQLTELDVSGCSLLNI